jgi:hypothetical protein
MIAVGIFAVRSNSTSQGRSSTSQEMCIGFNGELYRLIRESLRVIQREAESRRAHHLRGESLLAHLPAGMTLSVA